MTTTLRLTGTFALASLVASSAFAQRRPPGATDAPSPSKASTLPAGTTSNIRIVPLSIPRADVAQIQQQLVANAPKPKKGWGTIGSSILEGDKAKSEAAWSVLNTRAQALATDQLTTVVVVIGSEEERDKVIESLGRTTRTVVVAFVDAELQDATHDNTVFTAGIKGRFANQAKNMWVYLPNAGAPRAKPNETFPLKVASRTFWNGYFGAKGDGLDLQQLADARSRGDRGETAASAPNSAAHAATQTATATPVATTSAPAAPATAASTGGTPAQGDVVIPRVPKLKLYSQPSAQSSVVATVSNSDELLVLSSKDGFLQVQASAGQGWVSAVLVTKQK